MCVRGIVNAEPGRGSKGKIGEVLLKLPRWPIGCRVMLLSKTQTWREIQNIPQGTMVTGMN